MKKGIMIVMICLFSLAVFSSCGQLEDEASSEKTSESGEDMEDSSKDAASQIGEAVTCVTEDGGRMSITIKNYGRTFDQLTSKQLLYVDYEIENVGDQSVSVGNGMFSIYADDYAVEQSSLGDKAVLSEDVVPGKKVAARLYGSIDPKSADKIEVIAGNVTFAIKGEGVSLEAAERRLLREDQVSYVSADIEPITNIAGTYKCITKLLESEKKSTATVNVYPSPEDSRVGDVEINVPVYGNYYYKGEFVEIKTNVYQLLDQVEPVIISFTTNMSQEKQIRIYENGKDIAILTGGYEEQEEDETEAEENLAEETSEEAPGVEETEEIEETESSDSLSEYILPDSSKRLLKAKEVKDLSKAQCRLAKNEIYARHGRLFLDKSLQNYFDKQSWYNGYIKPEDFKEGVLSKTEKKNIKLLTKYEKGK